MKGATIVKCLGFRRPFRLIVPVWCAGGDTSASASADSQLGRAVVRIINQGHLHPSQTPLVFLSFSS